jgi:uncharacterized protein YciI
MADTFLVLLRPGPAWLPGTPTSGQPLKEHGRYLLGLFARGALQMAGPLGAEAGGAVVLAAADLAEARRLAGEDPAVRAGLFTCEVHPWHLVPWDTHLAAMRAAPKP